MTPYNWVMTVIAWIMVTSSLLSKFDGLPKQLAVNHKTRTVADIPVRFVLWGFVSYFTLTVHASFRQDWWTVLAQAPGAVLWGIWYWQLHRYPRNLRAEG